MIDQKEQLSSFKRIVSHQYFTNFLLYALTSFSYGLILNSIGALIPYLAAHENRLQTEYSGLFVGRALGYFSGPVLLMFIGHKLSYHQIIGTGLGLIALFSILFNLGSSLYFRIFCSFGTTFGGSFIDTAINLSALACFKGDNMSKWVQVIYGFFGIGGLLGPFVVYLFQLNSLTILGFFSLLAVAFSYFVPTPENQYTNTLENNEEQASQTPQLFPKKLLYILSFGFIFCAGQQATYGGWISSFAVLNDFSSKQNATFYTSLFWISITFFRFALTILPGSSSTKIQNLGILGIIATFISLFLIFGVNPSFGLVSMTILYGFSISILAPSLITVPEQFGYKVSINQVTKLIIISSFSMYSAVVVGQLMQSFSYNWLLYSMCLMNIGIVIVITSIRNIYKNQPTQTTSSSNLQQNLSKTTENPQEIQLKQKA